jgi:hypothetical protein
MATGGGAMHEHAPPEAMEARPDPAQARDVVRECADRLTQAYSHDRTNREDAVQDLKFLAGDQWPEFARQARVNRPMLTVNKLPQFLHQVTNDIRRNAPVLKVTPVDGKNDPIIAKIYDGLINDIQYRSSAKHVYAQSAYHATACGIGNWRVITRYVDDNTFDQEIALKQIPYPLSVYWDPAAVEPDRSDAMWCIVVDQLPRETFRSKYPQAMESSVSAPVTGQLASGLFWATNDYILVAEYWCKVPTMRTLSGFQSGEVVDTTDMGMQQLAMLQMQAGPIVQRRQAKGYCIEQSLVTGQEVLDGPRRWPGKYIPIVAVVGDEVPLERSIIRHGLVRHARDPQQLYNFYRSAAAEHIALSPKSPYLVTDKMIGKHKGDWDTLNSKNRPYLRYEPDEKAPGNKPERIAAPEPPQALWQEAQVATDDIKATTGIYDASLGAKSNETSGIAIKRRDEQGDTANFHYQDNLVRSLEQCGRIMIDLIPKIYDNQRVARLMSESGDEQFVPINHEVMGQDGRPVLLNDLSVGRYDIRVTVGPNYATKRLEAADAMIELMGKLPPEQAIVLADIAIRNMDIPEGEEAAKRLKSMLPPQALHDPDGPPPPPPNPLDDPVIAADVGLKQAQARKAIADAQKTMTEIMHPQDEGPALPPPPTEAERAIAEMEVELKALAVHKARADLTKTQDAIGHARQSSEIEALRHNMEVARSEKESAAEDKGENEPAEAKGVDASAMVQGLIDAMTAPKRIVMDASGKPVGVETGKPKGRG